MSRPVTLPHPRRLLSVAVLAAVLGAGAVGVPHRPADAPAAARADTTLCAFCWDGSR